ncbi:DUF397 domain-containing protein [Streptosporangium amethystogenes]|uniref:DUF397 domain-containing protein n=1 Tax=Streptosporangium amethystogenes TaxID=2002 RepID=UPI0009FF8E62|nr:DUF397 domain-containing protein [Streptosporangium amethystogenes]
MTDPTNAVWRKSSLSGSGNNCVEVAHIDNQYLVRDSKNPGGATLVFSPGDWAAFLGRVKSGDFDTRP